MRVSEISCHLIILWVRAFISHLRGRYLLLVLLSWMNPGVIGDRGLSFCKGIFPFDPIEKFPILMRKFKLIINIYFWSRLKLSCLKQCWFELFLVLWKSYMFSWRTNDEKLLCLKNCGRILSANSFGFLTMKPSPYSFQQMILSLTGSYLI